MSNPKPAVGTVSWTDLTVPEAKRISGFYEAVVGWKPVPLDMGGYSDFCMKTPAERKTVAGICHAKGNNANLPAQWLIYITVADLEASLRKCQAKAGKLLAESGSWAAGALL